MEEKVFTSDVTRVQTETDDLYSLLRRSPAVPIQKTSNTTESSIAFEPIKDKYYIPKKKSKIKVKTVRDIRNCFEKDIYEFLPVELEKQENLLLRKIKSGHFKDQTTKNLAKGILKLNKPISRSAWQILININPDNNAHPQQYVLWDGIHVRINGSKGGRTKFLHKHDLHNHAFCVLKNKTIKPSDTRENTKKNLLKTSVSIKFKPGPLSKKCDLDCSYQKHQVGKTELVTLPSPVLEVYPSYGHVLDPTVTSYLHNMRDVNGGVSQKWAELAASAVGTVQNGRLRKLSSDVIKFELNYKNEQARVLMRNNRSDKFNNGLDKQPGFNKALDTISEVKNMLNEMISSVEVSLEQDSLYKYDEPRVVSPLDINLPSAVDNIKDKAKKKYCELDRLDVTVIQLPQEAVENPNKICEKSFCTLGCICSSLECSKRVKGRCRKIECMFECKCDFSKYAYYEKCPEILSRLVSLDREISGKLAKEEQKFHQTVVMTGDKSIVLKGESRNLKTPEKYADFYKNMSLKNKIPSIRMLSVVSLKLNSKNIEPWCMVHNLYKCFCEGKFIESNSGIGISPELKQESNKTINESNTVDRHVTRSVNESNISHSACDEKLAPTTEFEDYHQCSRVLPFTKRKFSLDYYVKLGRKIVQMEANDSKLQKRLLQLGFKNQHHLEMFEEKEENKEIEPGPPNNKDITKNSNKIGTNQMTLRKRSYDTSELNSILIDDSESDSSSTPIKQSKKLEETEKWKPKNKTLVKWLENSYKKYKQDIERGIEKTSLDPPKLGVVTLYPWDFILSRYRSRKNLFLVSKSPPYRIFIAVNIKHPSFENCINIDEIRYADLHKYPTTVKNLISNASDLINHFFIFRGLSHCWELVGSVSKVDDESKDDRSDENESPKLSLDIDDADSCNDSLSYNNTTNTTDLNQVMDKEAKKNNVLESSKWFVMTIENDFSEIRFYRKGFFVKYDSIIKAINVSRSSGNTVRLSSVQQSDPNSTPHFGIYAIPNVNEYCVFIGPYDKDEPLGIETVKTLSDMKIKRTRGVWISTNKVDNLKVIDNPLDYLPSLTNTLQDEIQLDKIDQESFETAATAEADSPHTSSTASTISEESANRVTRIVIRKTNGFFKVLPQTQANANSSKACENDDLANKQDMPNTSGFSNIRIQGSSYQTATKPIAEIAPQIKDPSNKFSRMSILKPEEINKKMLEKVNTSEQKDSHIERDIEDFLATSVICAPPSSADTHHYSEIYLECKTVKGLGYIKGKLRDDNYLSFEFPGFKFSPFYKKIEAIEKINQVLSRKVYIPKHINLYWEIVKSQSALTCKTMLKAEELNSDKVLTTGGLLHKKHLLNSKLSVESGALVEINENLETSSEDEDSM